MWLISVMILDRKGTLRLPYLDLYFRGIVRSRRYDCQTRIGSFQSISIVVNCRAFCWSSKSCMALFTPLVRNWICRQFLAFFCLHCDLIWLEIYLQGEVGVVVALHHLKHRFLVCSRFSTGSMIERLYRAFWGKQTEIPHGWRQAIFA